VNRIWRPAALLALLLLSSSCGSASRSAAPNDQFPLDPREGLVGPFPPGVRAGWEALFKGHLPRARQQFQTAEAREPGLAAKIGLIEVLVEEASLPQALASCSQTLADADSTAPLLVACGEAHARSGQAIEGLELYRRALDRAGRRPGLEARAAVLASLASEQLRRQAQEAAGQKDWKAARQEIARAIELDPESGPARETAGDVELEAGDRPAALVRYRQALDLAPLDRTLWKKIATLALELSDYGVAAPVLDKLAAEDPSYEAQAAEARLSFRIANWPAAERSAALALQLTRGEAALLLWWMVPEVRQTKVTEGIIASDVVGRPDAPEITRVFSLQLLDVDRETHRASPDAQLTFSAACKTYLRLLGLLRPGRPSSCLSGRSADSFSSGEAIRAAKECRLIGETEGPPVSGATFSRSVDRVRALAARGENGSRKNESKTP
jgi:tetratricopeptide (TPR) repeat protein